MKNIFKIPVLFGMAVMLLAGCSEDEVKTYHGPNALSLSVIGDKAMTFSVYPGANDYTFDIRLSLESYQKDFDRPVKLILDPESEARVVSGVTFPDGEVVLEAGAKTVVTKVTVQRSILEDDEEVVLINVMIDPSTGFVTGTTGPAELSITNGYPSEWYYSNKPADYGALIWTSYAFGKCNKAKYRFVEHHFGIVDLAVYFEYQYAAAIALANEMNAAISVIFDTDPSDPLIRDEDGNVIKFSPNS